MSNVLTPADAERRLTTLDNEMAKATLWLRDARDAEVAAKHTYEAAHRRALLSKDCPKVTRGGFTTAERDAWVGDQCADEQRTYDIAVARREASADHLRTVREQAMVAMSLLRSANASMQIAGVAS